MFIKKFSFMVFALTLALAAGSCSKKAPEGVAAGDEPMATESTAPDDLGAGTLEEEASNVELMLPTIYFDYNESIIRGDAADLLQQAAEAIKAKVNVAITIEGHCDERGSTEYNLALGERRAQAVKSYLQTLGVDGMKLSTISYGEERPADFGHGESAWAKNRRAELIVNQ